LVISIEATQKTQSTAIGMVNEPNVLSGIVKFTESSSVVCVSSDPEEVGTSYYHGCVKDRNLEDTAAVMPGSSAKKNLNNKSFLACVQ
jgi:hypothetical protein